MLDSCESGKELTCSIKDGSFLARSVTMDAVESITSAV